MEQNQARNALETGSVLIRDGATLPVGSVVRESFAPGWKLVTDCDGARLDREIHKAGWRYFCLATVIKATAFGKDRQRMIRRTIERILKNPKLEQFNSLEIVEVGRQDPVAPPRLGRVTVSAQPRHIQQSMFLACNDRPGIDEDRVDGSGPRAAQNRIKRKTGRRPAKRRIAAMDEASGRAVEEMAR